MTNELIVVLETEINDDVIQQLKQADDNDPHLKEVIDAYAKALEGEDIEIFEIGNDFIVCENAIYIAVYEDELTEI